MKPNEINLLKEKDIYSIILYSIYKFKDHSSDLSQGYSSLPELIYSIGKDDLINLCSTFGGTTITIPTIEELKLFTNSLLIYYQLNTGEKKSFIEAFKSLNINESYKKDIFKIYKIIEDIINNYGK